MIVVEGKETKEIPQSEFGDYGFFKSAFKSVRKVTRSRVFKYGVPIATGVASGFTASWAAKQAAGLAAKKGYHHFKHRHHHKPKPYYHRSKPHHHTGKQHHMLPVLHHRPRPHHFKSPPIFYHSIAHRPKPHSNSYNKSHILPVLHHRPRPHHFKSPPIFYHSIAHRPKPHLRPHSYKKPHILPVLRPKPQPQPSKPKPKLTPEVQQKQLVELAKKLRAEDAALFKQIVALVNQNSGYLKPEDFRKIQGLIAEVKEILGKPRIIDEDTIDDLRDLKQDLLEAKTALTRLIAQRKEEYRRRVEEEKRKALERMKKVSQRKTGQETAEVIAPVPLSAPKVQPAPLPPERFSIQTTKPTVKPQHTGQTKAAVVSAQAPTPKPVAAAVTTGAPKNDFMKYALLGGGLLIAVMLITHRED